MRHTTYRDALILIRFISCLEIFHSEEDFSKKFLHAVWFLLRSAQLWRVVRLDQLNELFVMTIVTTKAEQARITGLGHFCLNPDWAKATGLSSYVRSEQPVEGAG